MGPVSFICLDMQANCFSMNNEKTRTSAWTSHRPVLFVGSVDSNLLRLLLLLFRHSAKSTNAQNEHLATSPQLVTRLNLPHAKVVRLHVRKMNVVILTPETAVTVDV